MYKGDLKRLILWFAGDIQSTFTTGEAFGAIKEADNREEVSAAISELYREGKLARQRVSVGNSFMYALPAFATAAFEMYEKPISGPILGPQEPQKPQNPTNEEKIDEVRAPASKEEPKPTESAKAPELVTETEREETTGIAEELKIKYFKSLDEIPDSEIDSGSNVVIESIGAASHLKINLPINSKFTLNAPSGLSITIESAGK